MHTYIYRYCIHISLYLHACMNIHYDTPYKCMHTTFHFRSLKKFIDVLPFIA